MDHYLDVRLLPDPEFPAPLLMNALFAKLHRALVSHGTGDVGVSFPEHARSGPGLGARLRLHGSAAALARLMAQDWLRGMRDHCICGETQPVPASVAYRAVRRVQAHSNPERERRRLIARKGLSEEAARAAIPDNHARRLDLPYITLASHSTGQQFRLFIEHGPLQHTATSGPFSAYGLSPTATLPWF